MQKGAKQRTQHNAGTTAKQSKLGFSEASVAGLLDTKTVLHANPVLLQYDPLTEYERRKRVIKHSTDKYNVDTDGPEHKFMDHQLAHSSSKSSHRHLPLGQYPLNTAGSIAYWKAASGHGRLRKVTLAKLDPISKTSELRGSWAGGSTNGPENDSLAQSLKSLQSKSVEDLFSTIFSEREETKKQLSDELCFTSKIATPRLLQTDSETQFKSKDLLNSLIEDVSNMSISTLGSKGHFADEGSVGTFRELQSQFDSDKANFDSVALCAEVRYLELKAQERTSGGHPSKLKATVCADLLLKLCTATGRYAKVMEPILWEVLNCVFVGFAAHEQRLRDRDGTLKALYSMPTYFDKHREQTELYDDIQNELEMVQQGKKMSEIVKRFQTVKMVFHAAKFFNRDCTFFLWKGEMLKSRQRRRTALRRSLLYRWKTWRAYLSRYQATEFEDMDTELDRKLESLSKLQVLLQAHSGNTPAPSPKHAEPVLPAAARSSKITLTRVSEGVTESTEGERDTVGFEDDDAAETAASAAVPAPPLSRASSSTRLDSSRGLSLSLSSKGSFVGPPPMSPTTPSRAGSSGKFLRERSSGMVPVLLRAPSTPSAPLTAREVNKLQESKLAQRKQLLVQVDASIRSTLSAMSMPVSEEHTPYLVPTLAANSFAVGEDDGEEELVPSAASLKSGAPQLSYSSESRSSKGASAGKTVDLLREAALIAAAVMCPRKDQTTQTPDVWMTNVNEQPFASPAGAAAAAIMRGTSMVSRPGLSRQNSGLRGNGPSTASPLQAVGKSLTSTVAKEEGRVDIGGFQPPAFKLESTAACQLITYIYSAKLKDGLDDHDEINFSECLPLLEYSKEALLKRYGLKRLADKFFRGLIGCVIKEGIINKRFEIFAHLCGLTLDGHKEGHGNYTEIQCSYYFRALGIIFGQNLHLLEQCMNSFEIDREIILEVLPDLFPAIEKNNAELARNIMFEVVDLPRNTPGNELEYKVNFDEMMGLLMDYFEEEHKLDPEDPWLYDPLVPQSAEPAPTIIAASGGPKPQSPEQALVALIDFAKPKPTAATPKRVRVIYPSQHLV